MKNKNNNLKGIELFSQLKPLKKEEDYEFDENKPSLYIDFYWNISEDENEEIDFHIKYQNYEIDKENNVINIIDDYGNLIFRLPYKK